MRFEMRFYQKGTHFIVPKLIKRLVHKKDYLVHMKDQVYLLVDQVVHSMCWGGA